MGNRVFVVARRRLIRPALVSCYPRITALWVLGNFCWYFQIVENRSLPFWRVSSQDPKPKLALFPLQEFKEYVEKRLASLEEPKAPYLDVGFWMFLVNLPWKNLWNLRKVAWNRWPRVSAGRTWKSVFRFLQASRVQGSKWPWKRMFQQLGSLQVWSSRGLLGVPCGNQTWQCEFPPKGGFNGTIFCQLCLFHCNVFDYQRVYTVYILGIFRINDGNSSAWWISQGNSGVLVLCSGCFSSRCFLQILVIRCRRDIIIALRRHNEA